MVININAKKPRETKWSPNKIHLIHYNSQKLKLMQIMIQHFSKYGENSRFHGINEIDNFVPTNMNQFIHDINGDLTTMISTINDYNNNPANWRWTNNNNYNNNNNDDDGTHDIEILQKDKSTDSKNSAIPKLPPPIQCNNDQNLNSNHLRYDPKYKKSNIRKSAGINHKYGHHKASNNNQQHYNHNKNYALPQQIANNNNYNIRNQQQKQPIHQQQIANNNNYNIRNQQQQQPIHQQQTGNNNSYNTSNQQQQQPVHQEQIRNDNNCNFNMEFDDDNDLDLPNLNC